MDEVISCIVVMPELLKPIVAPFSIEVVVGEVLKGNCGAWLIDYSPFGEVAQPRKL